ncbi:MAG: hypothetical protein JWM85_2066 [Acidimicrobiaceae bacterium]|nr:hypothetical protein [Acidimicrobiaceae bacterium]
MATGRLILRLTVGGLMTGHGLQKLTGSFGGPGLEGTEQMTSSLGLHPAKHQALAVALSETIGGALTALGLFFPLGPAMITGTQAVAIKKVHLKNGPWVTEGGFEYNATLIAAAFEMASAGPGPMSLDGLFGKQRSGLRWAIFQLLLGLGGAAATLAIADRMAPQPEPSAGPSHNGTAPDGAPERAAGEQAGVEGSGS